MIISNSQKYIFIHIQKTAGTSVMEALGRNLKWNDIEIGTDPEVHKFYREKYNLGKHSLAKEVKQVLGKEVWDNYFKFTFVRHPYSRAVSLYTYVQRMARAKYAKNRFPFYKRKDNSPFWSWLMTQAFLDSKNFSEFIRHEKFLNDFGAQSQSHWIFNKEEETLVDFIGKYENINIDFNKILHKIDSAANKPSLKQINISTGKKEPEFYFKGEKDYKHLEKIYEQDFRVFDYDPNLRF
ncbi:MAG: sulfotransferase family 2 domain-containing protein [Cyanobacteria bacterium J06621_3]